MKKIQKCLLALLVFCLAAGALVACTPVEGSSTNANNSTTTTQTPTPEPTEPEEKDTYTFTVVYSDTNLPVEGVMVQLCLGDSFCMMPATTDANGKVEYSLGSYGYSVYDIHIMAEKDGGFIPEGYSFDNTAFKTNATDKTYTLVLVKDVCEHEFVKDICTKCGEAKKYAYTVKVRYGAQVKDESKQRLAVEGAQVLITTGTKMVAQGTTDKDGNFVFEAPKFVGEDGYSGYQVVITDGIPDGYYVFEDLLFMAGDEEILVECYTKVVKDKYTIFDPLKINIGSTGHMVMDKKRFDDGDADDLMASAEDDSLYYFSVTPSKPEHVGHYKITISGVPDGVQIFLGHYPSTGVSVSHAPRKYVTGQNPTLEFNMEERYLKDSTGAWTYNNTWIFGVRVEGDANYPVEFDIKVERERDLIPGVDYTVTLRETVEIVEGAKKAAEIVGDISDKKLTNLTKETAASVNLVLGEDGFYHIGSADGAILMMNLKNSNPFFDDGEDAGVSFINVNAVSGTENLLVSYYVDDHYEVKLYAQMLKAYGELCGEDGYYPVNEQLHTFLKDWTNQRVGDLFKGGLDADHAFLLLCGYYA